MPLDQIRRDNLRKLVASHGASPATLARRLGYVNGTFITQMCGPNPIRNVSEANARRYEKTLGLPARWFDSASGDASAARATRARSSTDTVPPELVDVVRSLRELVEAEANRLPAKKVFELIELVNRQLQVAGEVDSDYLRRLVRLAA